VDAGTLGRAAVLSPTDLLGHPSVVSIGNFDGVHRGHQHLVGGAVRRARALGVASVVLTFDPHPLTVVRPDAAPARLTSVSRRVELLRALGVDRVLVLPFTSEVARWQPEEFLQRVLVDTLAAVEVHVGTDFRFGHRAAGDVPLLSRAGTARGFEVHATPLVGAETRWSSTAVRALLSDGEVAAAAEVLGRPHRLTGAVAHDPRGRPGDLLLRPETAVPASGAYTGRLLLPHGQAPGVTVCLQTPRAVEGDRHRLTVRTAAGAAVVPGGRSVTVELHRAAGQGVRPARSPGDCNAVQR
jgi:riboflavin kinase/FMN adenylyltransferase